MRIYLNAQSCIIFNICRRVNRWSSYLSIKKMKISLVFLLVLAAVTVANCHSRVNLNGFFHTSWGCGSHRCRNTEPVYIFLSRLCESKFIVHQSTLNYPEFHASPTVNPNFPYHHLQHLRRPSTHYTTIGANVDARGLAQSYMNRGYFLAYDSIYDPQFDPCTDCDESGSRGEGSCFIGQCHVARIFVLGRNWWELYL